MPIFELGYRHWEGRLASPFYRMLAITRSGIKLAFRSKFLRWIIIGTFVPTLYLGVFFFLLGYVTEDPRQNIRFGNFMQEVMGYGLADAFFKEPEKVRHIVWSLVFFNLMRHAQLWIVLIVIGLVGPSLISQDIKSRAFLLYYSRPITLFEYFIGKCLVVFVVVALVTLIPNLCLYIISIAFSPSIDALWQTWDIILKIFNSYLIIAIPCTIIVLFLSSITSDYRYATFGWFGLFIAGAIAREMVSIEAKTSWAVFLSLKSNLVALIQGVFETEKLAHNLTIPGIAQEILPVQLDVSGSFFVLLLTCLFCLYWIRRRLIAPVRI